MAAQDDRSVAPRRKRRWLQFSLRTLLLVMTCVAIWLGLWTERARRQKRAVEAITNVGGMVAYSYQLGPGNPNNATPPGPAWLRGAVGIDALDWVVFAAIVGDSVTDSDLEALQGLAHLKHLSLNETNSITDAGLVHLAGLDRLEHVDLKSDKITDAGLAQLERLRRLEWLELSGAGITDAGLAHLRPLRQLKVLKLHCTITDAGMEHLVPLGSLTQLESYSPRDDPIKARAVSAIRSPTMTDFVETPLLDVCSYLEDYHKVKFRFDDAAMKAARIDRLATVTCSTGKKRVCLGEALRSLLDPLGLDWHVAPGGITITTKDTVAERRPGILKLQAALPNLKQVVVDW